MGQAFRLNAKVQLVSSLKVKKPGLFAIAFPLVFDLNSINQEHKQKKLLRIEK